MARRSHRPKNAEEIDKVGSSSKIRIKYFNDTIPEKEVRSLLPLELAEEYLDFARQCLSSKYTSEEKDGQNKLPKERSQDEQITQRGKSSTEHKENMPMEQSDEENDTRTKSRRSRKTTKDLLKCLLCNKICRSKSEKQAHYNDHLSKRGYECTHCDKAFDRMPKLVSHVSRVHLINKKLSCKVCGQEFRREWLLRSHSLTHTSGRKFSCPVCKRGFTRKRDLFDHISGHLNYNPYKCEECGKRFQMSCYLSLHRKIHLAVRPFKCKFCDIRCVKYSDVETHALMHAKKLGVDCIECNVRISAQKYAHHILNHNRLKKNVQCTLCPAKFHAKSTLEDHVKAHKLIKEYKCDVCEKVMQTVTECSEHTCPKWADSEANNAHLCKVCNIYIKKSHVNIHNEKHSRKLKPAMEQQLELNVKDVSEEDGEEGLWTDEDDPAISSAIPTLSEFSPNSDDESGLENGDGDFSSSNDGSFLNPTSETLNLDSRLFPHVGFIQSDVEEEEMSSLS